MKKILFSRPCKDCGKLFLPPGKYYSYCSKCIKKRQDKGKERSRIALKKKTAEDRKYDKIVWEMFQKRKHLSKAKKIQSKKKRQPKSI